MAEASDIFGTALAVGDFDGDGYADLAIGVPYEEVGGVDNTGAVHVLYGAYNGLHGSRDQLWSQDSPSIEDEAEEDDWFRQALAAGDFDGDGYDDLFIGVPGAARRGQARAGEVHMMYRRFKTTVVATQGGQGLEDTTESDDVFGWALTVGDFNGDGYADLVIGVSGEDYGGKDNVGALHVVYGPSYPFE